MTRDQIGQRIRNNLDDAGVTYYNVNDVNDSIQDGYDEVAVYCECIERETDLLFQNNLTYYDFSVLIPDYYRVIRIYNFNLNMFLEIEDDREFLSYRDDWELIQNSQRSAMILGSKYVGFTGRTSTASGSFRVWYKATANKLQAGSVPRINDTYQILLEHYGTADLLEQNQEFSKAQRYWAQYDPLLEEYKRKIQLLAKADRVFTREMISR